MYELMNIYLLMLHSILVYDIDQFLPLGLGLVVFSVLPLFFFF
jgi:hypothetical protein